MPEEPTSANCAFCRIISREQLAPIVFEDDVSLAFLDHRPLFPGHCLLIPKAHYQTLNDLPSSLLQPLFASAQVISEAVEQVLQAEGTFVAINNKVSQSVPHLHIHIVPRRKGDGLKGFFWPRQRYEDQETIDRLQQELQRAILELRDGRHHWK